MKVFKILSRIALVASAAVFAVSVIMPGLTLEEADVAYFAALMSNGGIVATAIVGVFLICAANDTAKKIGHGLTISAYASALAYALLASENSAAAVVAVVAVVLLAVHYVFQLVIFIMNRGVANAGSPNDDARIIRIKEWKNILEEGIISPEEFEEKRIQILGIKTKNNKQN